MKIHSNFIFENKNYNRNRQKLRFWMFWRFYGFAALYDFVAIHEIFEKN
jgi:hypothetical protein